MSQEDTTSPEVKETGIECGQCGKKTGIHGHCPYDEEIFDEYTQCSCCNKCRDDCAMNI